VIGLLFLLCGSSQAATLHLYPSWDASASWTPQPAGNNYAMVDEVWSDVAATYNWTDTNNAYDYLHLTNIPSTGNPDSTINSLTIYVMVARSSAANWIYLGLRHNGVDDLSGSIYPSWTSYVERSYESTTNPDTSAAWQWDEINDIQGIIKSYRPSAGWLKYTQMWVVVDYDLPTGEIIRPTQDWSVSLTRSAGSDNYALVDEAVLDEADYVYKYNSGSAYDIYSQSNHSSGSGIINSVTNVINVNGELAGTGCWLYAKPYIRTGGSFFGDYQRVRDLGYISQTWDENPDTSTAWTWDEIDLLYAGPQLARVTATTWIVYCYQQYVIVDYTTTAATTSIPATRRIMTIH